MGVINEPRYDEDVVTKSYLDTTVTEKVTTAINTINGEIQDLDESVSRRAQNFGSEPLPPYYINDTYMNGTDIYICINERLIGAFNASDWSKASNYTDDTLASSMNKVFVNTPAPPYKIGDLWTTGPNGVLYRCKTSKILGQSYNIADWENATSYDDTKTTVQNGLVTTGTIQVVNGGTVAAGITGQTSGNTAIRFWAGSTFDNRGSAPFRVTQAGAINAISGVVGGCVIDAYGMYSGSGDSVAGIGLYGVRHAFWAGKNANESSSAPFRVGHDGTVNASNMNITGGSLNLQASDTTYTTLKVTDSSDSTYYSALNGKSFTLWHGSKRRAYLSQSLNSTLLAVTGEDESTAVFSSLGSSNTSDIRLKHNTKSIDLKTSYDIINALTPIEFTYKNGNTTHRGLSAQQVKKVLNKKGIKNQIYSKDLNNKYYMLNYTEFIPDLINCIKYQNKKINTLEKRLEKTEKRLEKTEKRLAKLEGGK